MSQTLQILNRMIEEMELAIIKAKAQLEYSQDEAMQEDDTISGDLMRDEMSIDTEGRERT